MHLGRTQQVVAFMIVWAAVLVGVDKMLNHAPVAVKAKSGHGQPQMTVTFTHFCCSGCYDKMFSAAKEMSWIVSASTDRSDLAKQEDLQKTTVDEGAEIETKWQKDATLILAENDLTSVDLEKVDQTFRAAGLVPRRIVLENIPHFRLLAVKPHLCCGLCQGAATQSFKLEQSREQVQAKIDDPSLDEAAVKRQVMPTFTVDKDKEMISAEYFQKADVSDFRMAMERAGFSPKEIRIEVL